MKVFCAALCFFFLPLSHAACPGEFRGRIDTTQFVIRTAAECGNSWGVLWVFRTKKKGSEYTDESAESFDVSDECDIPKNGFLNTSKYESLTLSCKAAGKSPLSGTQYVMERPLIKEKPSLELIMN